MSHPDMDLRSQIARDLLTIGAVSLSPLKPYSWASGKLSPVYCDNRLTLGYPEVRSRIADGFEKLIRENAFSCDLIVGTATAGIPHAAWLAHKMQLPMAYVRSAPKGHGKGNQIEGLAPKGAHAIVIEDLISTGMSSTAVLQPLADAGIHVEAIFAIFTYGLKAAESVFSSINVPLFTLTDFRALLSESKRSGRLSEIEGSSLEAWYKDPDGWSKERGGE
ncbi:MAG: orotate phosphoribosyltransferase [Bacteroidetes bacterium]|nr:orotate phosphoribosyltransferase [Bacteroidota bacterium]